MSKTGYTILELCDLMEVSGPKFYEIARNPELNFPKPLNSAPYGGMRVYYPTEECDLWLANNDVDKLVRRRNKRFALEDALLVAVSGKSAVGSVVEFQNAAGTKRIRNFLLETKTEIHLAYFPSRTFTRTKGWEAARRR